ncbi:MAG: hypothetical protein QM765_21860 [Myxococcales bacterium]
MSKTDNAAQAGGWGGMRLWWLAAVTGIAVGVSALPVVSCNSPTGDRYIQLKFSKNQIDADGKDSVDVFIEAIEADEKTASTGLVLLTTDRGHFNGEVGLINTSVTLEGGTAKVTFSCDMSLEPECSGKPSIEASWKGALAKSGSKLSINSQGDGGVDAGSVIILPTQLSAGKVYLLGTLREGSCDYAALMPLDNPSDLRVGFDCYDDNWQSLTPDGEYVYLASDDYRPRRFVSDQWVKSGDKCYGYPTNTRANDPYIPIPGCDDGIAWGRYSADGAFYYRCLTKWYVGGVEQTRLGERNSLLFGANELALDMGAKELIDKDGKVIKVTSPDGSSIYQFDFKIGRASGTGFRIVVYSGGYEQWHVAPDGTTTKEGEYADGYGIGEEDVMDGEGNVYSIEVGGLDVVTKIPLKPAAASTAYDEESTTPDNYCVYPPKVRVKIHASSLVTGP